MVFALIPEELPAWIMYGAGALVALLVLLFLLLGTVRSLAQAVLLLGFSRGQGRSVVHGRVKVQRAERTGPLHRVLWFERIRERYERERKHDGSRVHGWTQIGYDQRTADFTIRSDGHDVRIVGDPTGVHGKKHWVRYDHGGRLFLGFGSGRARTRYDYLPVRKTMTAVGRLEQRGGRRFLVRDAVAGLKLSAWPPAVSALGEGFKALLGFATIGALIAGGFYVWQRWPLQ